MTNEDISDLLKAAHQGWSRAVVFAWRADKDQKENFYKDINEKSASVRGDILALMNCEYVLRKPVDVIHYIADKGLHHSEALDVAQKYIPTANWIKTLVTFDDKNIDPAMIDEWKSFKHSALAADEDFFEGADFLAKTLYCLACTAKLIDEYNQSTNNPDMLNKFRKDLANGNILNFVRYCPNGADIALENLPEDLVFRCNYRKYFDSINRFKNEKLSHDNEISPLY